MIKTCSTTMYDVNDVRHWGIDPAIAGSELDFG